MYKRFTDRARKVMQLANQEAQRFNHEYVGTEHILLGLIKEGSGVAAHVLKNLDVNLRKVRLAIEQLVQSGSDMVTIGKLPQTPATKKVIEYSIEESKNLNHNYIGTEHLLLGLIRQEEGVVAQVLANLGVSGKTIVGEVYDLLGHGLEKEQITHFAFNVSVDESEDAKVVGQIAAHYKNVLGRIKEAVHHADSKAMDEIRIILKDI